MAVKINLLPTEMKVSGTTAQVLRIIRTLGVIALAGFLIFSLGIGAFFAISSIDLNNLNSTNESLKSQIDSLSATESQQFILKDRLDKIQLAENSPSALKNLKAFEPYVANVPAATVNQLEVDSANISAVINIRSNTDLGSFVEALSTSDAFKQVTVSSFGFNPTSGYTITLSIKPK